MKDLFFIAISKVRRHFGWAFTIGSNLSGGTPSTVVTKERIIIAADSPQMTTKEVALVEFTSTKKNMAKAPVTSNVHGSTLPKWETLNKKDQKCYFWIASRTTKDDKTTYRWEYVDGTGKVEHALYSEATYASEMDAIMDVQLLQANIDKVTVYLRNEEGELSSIKAPAVTNS